MRLLVALLLISSFASAEITYTYTGATYSSVTGPFDTSMQLSGSFVLVDELDETTTLYPVKPLRYSFTDGVQTFDESNSELILNASVAGGELRYWYLEVGNYPRPSNTDLSDRGWIVSTTNNNGGDDVFYRPCEEEQASNEGTCREIQYRASGDTGIVGSWVMTGSSLPPGQNTVLDYEGQQFTELTLAAPFYSGDDQVTGTVKIAGLVTPGARYADEAYAADVNNDIVEFSFSDGVNTFDQNNSHACTTSPNRRVSIKFDADGDIDSWSLCLTTRNADYSFQFEHGTIISQGFTAARDSVLHYECSEYEEANDRCAIGASELSEAKSTYGSPGSWRITPPTGGEPPDDVNLLVRCIHQPLWPEEGQEITVSAEPMNGRGEIIQADLVEIYTADNPSEPSASHSDGAALEWAITPSGPSFRYGCVAKNGPDTTFSGWRETDVGEPALPDARAVPVIYTGKSDSRIDVVFMPEMNRHGIGADGWERFLEDAYDSIREGIYGIPWFLQNQQHFNFWLARDYGRVTRNLLGLCERHKPDGFKANYAFADTVGMLHRQDCRDNVSPTSWRVFTTKMYSRRLQVVSHEIGHSVFKLSDEYTGSGSIYFTTPKYPNLFPMQAACESAAIDRGFDPNGCRKLQASGASGAFLGGNWIFEPDYRMDSTPWAEVRDLMQQTGGEGECELVDDERVKESPDKDGPPIACYDRYDVGDSETARMENKLEKCRAGRC